MKYISYLIILLPLSLITGPFLGDLIVTVIALFFVYVSIKFKLKNYYNNPIVLIVVFFWIYITINSLLSTNPLLSLESSLFYIRFILFALGTSYLLNNNNNNNIIKYTGYSTLICFIFLILDAHFQFFVGKNILGYKNLVTTRISSIFKDELILGSYIARLTPFLFYLLTFLDLDKFKKKILQILLLSSIITTIYLTGERAAFAIIIMFIGLSAVALADFRKILFPVFFLSIVVAVIISFVSPDTRYRMINSTINNIYNMQNNEITAFTSGHQRQYITAYKMFLAKPIIGHGPKMFRDKCHLKEFNTNACTTHPHNTYMQLLAETGIIGTSIISIIFIFLVYKYFKKINFIQLKKTKTNQDNVEIYLIIAMIATLWPIIPSGSFFNNWINLIYYLPLGFYLNRKNTLKSTL